MVSSGAPVSLPFLRDRIGTHFEPVPVISILVTATSSIVDGVFSYYRQRIRQVTQPSRLTHCAREWRQLLPLKHPLTDWVGPIHLLPRLLRQFPRRAQGSLTTHHLSPHAWDTLSQWP